MTTNKAIQIVCDFAENRLNGHEEQTVILLKDAIMKVREIGKLKRLEQCDNNETKKLIPA